MLFGAAGHTAIEAAKPTDAFGLPGAAELLTSATIAWRPPPTRVVNGARIWGVRPKRQVASLLRAAALGSSGTLRRSSLKAF